jgi:hypothetical protein
MLPKIVTRTATVPDIVSYRVDFADRLRSLKRRDRRIAESLALGNRTSHVAKKFKVSGGRVSHLQDMDPRTEVRGRRHIWGRRCVPFRGEEAGGHRAPGLQGRHCRPGQNRVAVEGDVTALPRAGREAHPPGPHRRLQHKDAGTAGTARRGRVAAGRALRRVEVGGTAAAGAVVQPGGLPGIAADPVRRDLGFSFGGAPTLLAAAQPAALRARVPAGAGPFR